MSTQSQTKSDKIGCLYKATYIERFFIILEETDLSLTLLIYPTYSKAVVSKAEFLSSIAQNQVEYIATMQHSEITDLQKLYSTADKLEPFKQAYEDYHRRKQSIISSELCDS
jgi:hypothetical protein